MTLATRLMIASLLAQNCAEKRTARNLARAQLGHDHPLTQQHQIEVERAEEAMRDFNDTQEVAA